MFANWIQRQDDVEYGSPVSEQPSWEVKVPCVGLLQVAMPTSTATTVDTTEHAAPPAAAASQQPPLPLRRLLQQLQAHAVGRIALPRLRHSVAVLVKETASIDDLGQAT